MKKIFFYPAALLFFLFIVSCKKEQLGKSVATAQPNQYIDATVAPGETFTFVAGTTGSLSVSKQALHFEVSEALNENGSVYYNYKPSRGYMGSDEVALMYLAGESTPGINSSAGCPANHNNSSSAVSTIVIRLNVTK